MMSWSGGKGMLQCFQNIFWKHYIPKSLRKAEVQSWRCLHMLQHYHEERASVCPVVLQQQLQLGARQHSRECSAQDETHVANR